MRIPRGRWKRDSIFITFGLGLAAVNAVALGAQASTYTFCLGLLLSPVVLRIEEGRRDDK
jgi:hypothetical protein